MPLNLDRGEYLFDRHLMERALKLMSRQKYAYFQLVTDSNLFDGRLILNTIQRSNKFYGIVLSTYDI
jgi:hypothetical protein